MAVSAILLKILLIVFIHLLVIYLIQKKLKIKQKINFLKV